MPVLKAGLSASAIGELIAEVKAYQKKVEQAPAKIAGALASRGEDLIAQGIAGIQDKDGNYLAQAGSYVYDNVGFAYMEGDQAAYLEYGTGITGQGTYDGTPPQNWEYNSGKTIQRTGSWSYWDSLKRQHVHTKGIPAQMPVWKAAQKLRAEAVKTAKEALK